jgi:hypothetical protein
VASPQAWEAEEAAAGGQELSKEAKWEVAVQLLVEDGDPETAERWVLRLRGGWGASASE